MTLRTRISLVWLCTLVLIGIAVEVLAHELRQLTESTLVAVAVSSAALSYFFVRWCFVKITLRAIIKASRCADAAALRRVLGDIRSIADPRRLWALEVDEALVLLYEERWAEALDRMLAIDRTRLTNDQTLAVLDNNIAWARLNLGEGDAAVALAEQALARATDLRSRASCLCTLGAALVVAGRANEAVPILERALEAGDESPASQATRAFWLGEAWRALGRNVDARNAYERAVRASGATAWGRRARAQIDALPPGPYR